MQIAARYDIILIQEIRDNTNTAITTLIDRIERFLSLDSFSLALLQLSFPLPLSPPSL